MMSSNVICKKKKLFSSLDVYHSLSGKNATIGASLSDFTSRWQSFYGCLSGPLELNIPAGCGDKDGGLCQANRACRVGMPCSLSTVNENKSALRLASVARWRTRQRSRGGGRRAAACTHVAGCACRWRSSAAGRRDSRVACNFSSGRWSVWTTHSEPLQRKRDGKMETPRV